MWLKVVGNSPALDVERTIGRPVGTDKVAFEDDHLMPRPRKGQRRRQSRNAASSDNELHLRKVTGY